MQQIARSVALAFNNLPRPHRVMLGSLTVLTLAVAVWRPYVYHRDATPIVKTIELEQNEIRSLLPEASEPIDQAAQEDEAIPQDELDDKIAGEAGVHEYVVSTGDTLSSILNQYGIDMGDITQLAAADKELRNLKIGQQLSWTLTADGELQRLTWEVSRRETRTYDRTAANGFKMTSEMQQGEWVNNLLKGTVGGSFVASARNAGLTSAEVSAVIKAMQWQMDFRKLKKGDEFAVLMSREMLDGKREQSQLLGVRLRSEGKDYTEYNLKEAQAAFDQGLKELGVSSLKLRLLYGTDETPADTEAEYLQACFKKLKGLDIEMVATVKKDRVERQKSGDFDISCARWGPDFPDPITYLNLVSTGNSNNYGKYNNAKYDQLIAASTTERDAKKRWQMLYQAEDICMSEYAVLPVFQKGAASLQNKKYSGIVYEAALGSAFTFKFIHKTK